MREAGFAFADAVLPCRRGDPSARPRGFQCHGLRRLPLTDESQSVPKKKFTEYPMGYLPLYFAEGQTEQGRQSLFGALDRTSKGAFAE